MHQPVVSLLRPEAPLIRWDAHSNNHAHLEQRTPLQEAVSLVDTLHNARLKRHLETHLRARVAGAEHWRGLERAGIVGVLPVGAAADENVLLFAVPAPRLGVGHAALGELGTVHEAKEVLGRRPPAVLELLGRGRCREELRAKEHQLTSAGIKQRTGRDGG
eukprot:5667289-Prymnesium_polylepis.2